MSPEQVAALEALVAGSPNGKPGALAVSFDAKGKLILPPVPAVDDGAGQCAWLAVTFALDPAHPITGGAREGLRGALGHVVLYRAGAPALRFEPASRINQAPRLIEDLSWQTLRSDGAVHALNATHCRLIAHVVRMLTDSTDALDEQGEARGIITALLGEARGVEGLTTYEATTQRYEAANALQRDTCDQTGRAVGPTRYLIDRNTGEYVVRVGDLGEAGRRFVGSSLPRGWLDARMKSLGWARVALQGYAQPGRAGRTHGAMSTAAISRSSTPTTHRGR